MGDVIYPSSVPSTGVKTGALASRFYILVPSSSHCWGRNLTAPERTKRPMSTAQTFEQSLSRLEEVVARLESGDLPLDVALERYEEGVRLVGHCRTDLERAELKVKRLVERNGKPEVEEVPASDLFGGAK